MYVYSRDPRHEERTPHYIPENMTQMATDVFGVRRVADVSQGLGHCGFAQSSSKPPAPSALRVVQLFGLELFIRMKILYYQPPQHLLQKF